MVKRHLKTLSVPKSWKIKKKESKFILNPNPGPHSKGSGIPLGVFIRNILGYAKNLKEVKFMLNNRNVLVDGIKRSNPKFPVGLFDSVEFTEANECFRMIFDNKGKITSLSIDKPDAKNKPCKVTGKTKVRGKTQLNLYDGNNILVDKDDYKVGDTLLLELPKKSIKEHIKFGKGVMIYLVGGKHTGQTGKIEAIKEDKISYKNSSGEVIETLKKYAFVIGSDKPVISLSKK
ncbi:30S ribosomal protein S4e [Candidatus Woesearchaeota archaeon]|nr:30S ribosomal protein S4e [Candidatus Woesearchaeota archaeon]